MSPSERRVVGAHHRHPDGATIHAATAIDANRYHQQQYIASTRVAAYVHLYSATG